MANLRSLGKSVTGLNKNGFNTNSNIDTLNVLGATDGSQISNNSLNISGQGLKGNRTIVVTNTMATATSGNSVQAGSTLEAGSNAALTLANVNSGTFTFQDGASTVLRLTGPVNAGANINLGDDTLVVLAGSIATNAATTAITKTRNVVLSDNGNYTSSGDGLVLGDGFFLVTASGINGNPKGVIAAEQAGIEIGVAALAGRTMHLHADIDAPGSNVFIGSPDTFNSIAGGSNLTRTTAVGTGEVNIKGDINADLVTVQSTGTVDLDTPGAVRNNDWLFKSPVTGVAVHEDSGLGTGTATLESGIKLWADAGQATPFVGATIVLNGGTELEYNNKNANRVVGGNIVINGGPGTTTLDVFNGSNNNARTTTFGSFDFGTGANPQVDVLTNKKQGVQTSKFVNSVIHNSGTINLTESQVIVELNDVAVVVGATLTQTGVSALNITDSFGARLRGSGDLLAPGPFNLVTNSGSGSLTDVTPIFDSSNGLWTLGGTPGTTIDVSLDSSTMKGSFAVGGGSSFSAEDAGWVEILDLVAGTDYNFDLDLASPGDIGDVISELELNPDFTLVSQLDSDTVRILLTSDITGIGNFAWDNVIGHSLGSDVIGVNVSGLNGGGGPGGPAIGVPEPSSVAIWTILGLCLAGYGYRRRRNS